MSYGCHDRPAYKPYRAQDGWWCDGHTLTPRATLINPVMARDCQYTKTALGQADKGCDGCKHKQLKGAA